jgi:electron transfer flavoprotein alpha subunit
MNMAIGNGLDIWVFAEQRGGVLHEVGFELIGKGRSLLEPTGGRVSAILFGSGVEEVAEELIKRGADRVMLAESDLLEPYRLMPFVDLLANLCKKHDPQIVLFGATSLGMELAPRLAARLNTGLSAHCIDLQIDENGKLLQMVPGWGGGVIATIRCPDHRPQMATVMPGVMKKREPEERSGEVVRLEVGEDLDASGPRVLGAQKEEPKGGVSLEGADVVVAGGWGIGGEAGWNLVEALAEALGGAVGATRPPVDEGWAREDQMIGQSGRTVRCRLYIGIGISGMMHHVVGMDESDFVVAINTDPKAAIFEVSDIAIVGDYREIVPALVQEIKTRWRKPIEKK